MNTYLFKGSEDFKLMSQKGVKQYMFESEPNNSIWDSNVGPNGKMYMSLSSELTLCGYARLYEYDPKTNQGKKLFEVEKVILPQERAMRASKFHTSISFLNNGKLAMTTHSTDRAPSHPTWLPEQHYGHIWEGFAGSNIVVYDPKTKETSNLGIPVPRESLYGSIYDPKHNALYSLGFMRGHLYRYSFDDKTVIDLGQVSEGHSFRMVLGPDGNIYSATKSGYMFKIDTDKQKVIDMNYRVPFYSYGDNYTFGESFGNIAAGKIGPDGRIYFSIMYGPDIIALDTRTGKIENMGPYLPTPRYAITENRNGVFGIDFDSNGVLWYHVSSCNDGSETSLPSQPGSLFRWDILNGGKPEWIGIVGTTKRVFCCMSELFIHDDLMVIVETNHGQAPASIMTIDLNEFEPTMTDMKKVAPEELEDKMFWPNAKDIDGYAKIFDDQARISAANPHTFDGNLDTAFRIWRKLAPDDIENSGVTGIVWDDDNALHGICGKERKFGFKIVNERIEFIDKLDNLDNDYVKWLCKSVEPKKCTCADSVLPSYPGRQFKAVPTVCTPLTKDRVLIGTLDGLLAICDSDRVYSLGMAGYNGPVRALSSTPDKKTVYGVAGDVSDLGMVFKYDDENGLILKGNIKHGSSRGTLASLANNVLSCCSISKDGKKLAIASEDRLGTVYIYNLSSTKK
ncbi:MAG: hypothetical protein PHP06_10545 [Clostridia bacterium]|nr:hypothetical protein [Clostridia bacterium]